jgi:hypothetical protein
MTGQYNYKGEIGSLSFDEMDYRNGNIKYYGNKVLKYIQYL